MKRQLSLVKTDSDVPAMSGAKGLLADVRGMILEARQTVARGVNAALVVLYWNIGQRIRTDVLKEKRAEYGERIVAALGRQLEREFGRGYGEKNLRRFMQFSAVFPDEKIVAALRRQLGWTHFKAIIPIADPLKRNFYAEMCRLENWNTRTLTRKIGSLLFERTTLSRRPAKLAEMELKKLREQDKLTPDLVFRDPYLLDFLGLKDTYAEKDLEAAILREMEAFILELGVGFCFVERQKRMQIDDVDYYLDLLFYHRKLRRLVAVDLKLGVFEAADKGQMELYLKWLRKYEQGRDEGEPLGIILCAGKRQQHVELLEAEKSGIHVASYLTKAVPKKEMERKLHEAMLLARSRLAELKKEEEPGEKM